MPFTFNAATRLYWEEYGAGEPLLLITGLGVTLDWWRRLIPALAERYRVIAHDNRGTGRSSDVSEPFTIAEMAADAKSVLRAAGVSRAHVMGASMGGMIAQEFALNYPEMVRSLILSVTMCGGKEAIPADEQVLAKLPALVGLSAEDAFWEMAPFTYHAATPQSVLEDDLRDRLEHELKPENYIAQLQAILSWQGSFSRLGEIAVPTLVLHGESDQLIVPENGRNLAKWIDCAKYVEIENASHTFVSDQTERSAEEVLGFLEGV